MSYQVDIDNLGSNIYLSKYKRYFDFVIATILLTMAVPIMITAMILIKISSRGPVVYKQQRVGLDGKLFVCYKLRTMHILLDGSENNGIEKNEVSRSGILDKRKDDKRITKIGSFLRRMSIDELPQLFNVLRGDMSLVGPRPLIPFMLEPFPEIKLIRCKVLPGVTGLWQVKSRKQNTTVLDMINYDLEYIRKVKISFDIYLLFLTILAIIDKDGAY